jgi:SAM-dependent methyltransferase
VIARIDSSLSRFEVPRRLAEKSPPRERVEEIQVFLRSLIQPETEASGYLEVHLERIARTLTLVPVPGQTGRVLELGAYMQMTPALECILGYREVRGAYYGALGEQTIKVVSLSKTKTLQYQVDLFDAEKDIFPYAQGYFETVLACEIIEHLVHDPMHMLLEIRRVLSDNGVLILTTPNIASFTSVARILNADGHPQIHSRYTNPQRDIARVEIPHVREYTPQELRTALESAGFDVVSLFTEEMKGYGNATWIKDFLEKHRYPTDYRGEQIYCIARKKPTTEAVIRYPGFLYEK